MVDMKMCADDAIDCFAGTSDFLQVLQEGQLQLAAISEPSRRRTDRGSRYAVCARMQADNLAEPLVKRCSGAAIYWLRSNLPKNDF